MSETAKALDVITFVITAGEDGCVRISSRDLPLLHVFGDNLDQGLSNLALVVPEYIKLNHMSFGKDVTHTE